MFADFVPAATGETLTLTSTLDVAGDLQPVPLGEDSTESTVDGLTVTLDGAPAAGTSSKLTFTVTRDGVPVTTLQPYLGASGHLVALRIGDLAYLHVHPMDEPAGESGPEVAFMARGTHRWPLPAVPGLPGRRPGPHRHLRHHRPLTRTPLDRTERSVMSTAFQPPQALGHIELQIGGMTCASCAMRIEKKLNKLDGVQATVNYATEKAQVTAPADLDPQT